MVSETQKKLLKEIFNSDSKTMDAKKFRAMHAKLRPEIDLLEKSGFIKRKQEQNTDCYSVSLIALKEINNSEASKMLNLMNRLFLFLKESYVKDPDAPVSYADLASRFDVPINEVHQLLMCMKDVPFLGGYSTNPMHPSSAHITLGEPILDYESFQDGIDQQADWAANRLENSDRPDSPIFNAAQGLVSGSSSTDARHTQKWPKCVPDNISPILKEISAAFEHQLFALTVMGLRTVIDLVGGEVAGDKPFKNKLSGLVTSGYLTTFQKENLESALEAGHATIHRGFIPTVEDAERVVDIVHHLLVSVYGNQHKEKLDESTPKRKNKK